MNVRRESTLRTLAVAVGVAVICSLIVSAAVFLLRPYQLAYSALDRNRSILVALGSIGSDDSVEARDVVARFVDLDRRIVDLQAGVFTTSADIVRYDFREALQATELIIDIPEAEDVGGIGARPRLMPVYLHMEAGQLQRIAMPIYASGMWSTIYAYISLESDLSTIAGIAFYEHGETPGIGDRILNPDWLAGWIGKELYGPDGGVRFRITADTQAAEPQHRVDSITGATVTVEAIGDAVQYWFSEHGYGRFLEQLAQEAP